MTHRCAQAGAHSGGGGSGADPGRAAGSDSAYQALFDGYGVVRVETLDELATTLLLFSTGRRGVACVDRRIGGECESTIDLADRCGFAPIGATTSVIAAMLDVGLAPEQPARCRQDHCGQVRDLLFGPACRRQRCPRGFSADIRDNYYLSDAPPLPSLSVATTTKPVAFVTNYTQLRHDAIALRLTQAGVPVLDGSFNGLIAVRGALAQRLISSATDLRIRCRPLHRISGHGGGTLPNSYWPTGREESGLADCLRCSGRSPSGGRERNRGDRGCHAPRISGRDEDRSVGHHAQIGAARCAS